MKKFKISSSTLLNIKDRAKTLPLLNNSIRGGEGTVVAYIGEEVVKRVLHGKIEDTYDYDVTYGDGTKVDVKTKERTVPPRENYNCTVADFNTKQKCDRYAFVRVEYKNRRWGRAWLLGWLTHDEYFKKAKKLTKGEIDHSNGFLVKADCYNVAISDLKKFRRKKK